MEERLLKKRKVKAENILKILKTLFPNPKIELKYSNPLELLIAVILSAQCTDKKVNEVTEKLFKKYKSLNDYMKADLVEFENDIRSIGLFRSKAKNILASVKMIKENYTGKVPNKMDELLKLPGVARKTANVVLSNAYGIVEGIAVDTHVKRLSNLLGLSDYSDPNKIEKDLMEIFPKSEWKDVNHSLVLYGRYYCPAKSHEHSKCPLNNF